MRDKDKRDLTLIYGALIVVLIYMDFAFHTWSGKHLWSIF